MPNEEFEFEIDPDLRSGIWVNVARVREGPDDFIIDLAARDPDDEGVAILLARVRCPPLAAKQLADRLNAAWRRYARHAFPKEVIDADPELESESEEDQGQG